MMKEQRRRVCDASFSIARLAFFLCAGGSFLQTAKAVVEVETGVTSDGIFGWSASVGVGTLRPFLGT